MRKKVLSFITIIVVTIISSSVWAVRPDSFFSSTIFTIAGIMFAVGMGLIVTFNPNGVKNKNFVLELRNNIKGVRNSFLWHITLLTIYYILNQYVTGDRYELSFDCRVVNVSFSFSIFLCLMMIYSSIFFVVNFLEIQKLNNDIFDVINEENP